MGVKVVRKSGEMVKPSEKTPTGTVELSGMDKVPVLRCNCRTLHVYKAREGELRNACAVIKEAVSKALVPYYPLGGRVSESHAEIECSPVVGVWVVEASADCTLQSLDYLDHYHYPDLLPLQPPNHPLIQMQVTQFACGGFVIGLVFNHTVCDGLGAAQFLNAVGEMARGLPRLSVEPVWCRDFFVSAPTPTLPPMVPPAMEYVLEQANVDISMDEIKNQKRLFSGQTGGLTCSTFELVTAALWRCRSMAIGMGGEQSELVFLANCRHLVEPPLPRGFYGNCFFPVRVSMSMSMRGAVGEHELPSVTPSLVDVVKLIQKAKAELPSELAKFRAGLSDPFAGGQPPSYGTVVVSEWGRLGFNEVDVGWGPPAEVVPIQGSPFIPAAIVGRKPSPTPTPTPTPGIRLTTWCLQRSHLHHFLRSISQLFNP